MTLLSCRSLWSTGASGPALLVLIVSMSAPVLASMMARRTVGMVSFAEDHPDALRFYRYTSIRVLIDRRVPLPWLRKVFYAMVPMGFWGPTNPKQRAGSSVSLYRQVWAITLAPLVTLETLLFGVVAAVPAGTEVLCSVQFAMLGMVRLFSAVLLLWIAPYRTRVVALFRIVGAIAICIALGGNARLTMSRTADREALMAIEVGAAVMSVMALLAALHALAIRILERHLNRASPTGTMPIPFLEFENDDDDGTHLMPIGASAGEGPLIHGVPQRMWDLARELLPATSSEDDDAEVSRRPEQRAAKGEQASPTSNANSRNNSPSTRRHNTFRVDETQRAVTVVRTTAPPQGQRASRSLPTSKRLAALRCVTANDGNPTRNPTSPPFVCSSGDVGDTSNSRRITQRAGLEVYPLPHAPPAAPLRDPGAASGWSPPPLPSVTALVTPQRRRSVVGLTAADVETL